MSEKKAEHLSEIEIEHRALGLDATRYQNIPRSLQGAGFLHWDCRADRPKQPHFNGDFHISWSDPEAWNDFDTVTEIAAKNSTYGIGYVNGAGNKKFENGHRATIDLDGAIDENGELQDWVPSLEPFIERGAYIEYSVSYAGVLLGEENVSAGLHIPVKHWDGPEWWTDSQIAEHEGIDVLENKFCTVTGVPYENAGTEVVEYGKWINEWLAEAYRNINDEDAPRYADSDGVDQYADSSNPTNHTTTKRANTSRAENNASREDVESALQNVGYASDPENPKAAALHYNDWIAVAYAVHSWNEDPETTREVFDDWTEESPKYEEPESREAVDWIWNNAKHGDGDNDAEIALGRLFYMAMQNGWEGPSNTDYIASPVEAWGSWSARRIEGDQGSESLIPVPALEHIAREKNFYDFEKLDEDVDELPPKAHNRALWWVNNVWAEEHLGEDEQATARRGKARTSAVVTWEDVRYIYEENKNAARHAAESLLRSEYHFMTIDEYDQLHVYNDSTGVYTSELAEIRGEVHDGLGEHWSTHESNEILARLRQSPRPTVDDLNGSTFDSPHICVKNGVLDIFGQDLKEHSPEHYFTDRMPVAYDSEADTSAYEEFLDELTDRPEDKKALLEMVGHAVTPDAYSRGWKKFLILTGDTNNGKSVFFSRVQSLLNGPDSQEGNTANVKLAKIARNQFSNNSVYGKWANIAGEIDGKKIRNTASIKDITGGDPVEIEPKGKDSFFDSLDATFMFAANDPPIIGERDKAAIASRIVPIELPNTFVDNPEGEYEKQKKPEEELRNWLDNEEALSGFLRLAVEGANRLRENHGDVSLPESYADRLQMYERKADPMREFGERCLTNSDGDYLVKADATTIYKQFASSLGHEVGQNTDRTLHNVLRGLPDLNYTDSRPRSPDYSGTSMDLRGWDERKRVINRVRLTDEGMEYARSAGLVEEQSDPEEQPDYYTPETLDLAEYNDRDVLDVPLRASPTAAWEGDFNQPVAELVGDTTETVDVRYQGPWESNSTPVEPGKEHEYKRLRVRNRPGERPYLEHRPTTVAELLEDSAADENEKTETEPATDGGDSQEKVESNEYEGITGQVREYLRVNAGKNEEVTAASIAGQVAGSPGEVQDALNKLATNGLLEKSGVGVYRVL